MYKKINVQNKHIPNILLIVSYQNTKINGVYNIKIIIIYMNIIMNFIISSLINFN